MGADGAPTAQVVSDTRRLSDVEWFRDVYGDVVQTVRVVATEETRKRRNWVFVTGEHASGASPSTLLAPRLPHRHGSAASTAIPWLWELAVLGKAPQPQGDGWTDGS